jgi:hypothetical protein
MANWFGYAPPTMSSSCEGLPKNSNDRLLACFHSYQPPWSVHSIRCCLSLEGVRKQEWGSITYDFGDGRHLFRDRSQEWQLVHFLWRDDAIAMRLSPCHTHMGECLFQSHGSRGVYVAGVGCGCGTSTINNHGHTIPKRSFLRLPSPRSIRLLLEETILFQGNHHHRYHMLRSRQTEP